MQTEQFDDAFRKKLLAIDPVTDGNEVDRIHNYVISKGKIPQHFSWTEILLYGLVASSLLGSLTFNYVQNIKNNRLFAAMDSLKNEVAIINPQKPEVTTIVRVDTVYINRYAINPLTPAINHKSIHNSQDAVVSSDEPSVVNSKNETAEGAGTNPVDSLFVSTAQPIKTTATVDAQTRITDPARKKPNGSQTNNKEISEYGTFQNQTKYQAVDKNKNDLLKDNTIGNSSSENRSLLPTDLDQELESGRLLSPVLSEINTTSPTSNILKLPIPKQPEKPIAQITSKPKYYAQSIKSVLKKMNYFVGGSFDVGNNQIGGSLLGEVHITPKWSVQTGARWNQITGKSYYTAEQFQQQTGNDFRKFYAPYVAQNVELLNIDENYQIVQIPLMIAYHFELIPNWALRLGLGTDISVYTQQHFHFDYKENNLSFDQGEYNAKLPIRSFNNLNASLGLERRWNDFIFRASPYLNTQLRTVGFSSDKLSWGARFQVFYKIK